MKEERSMLILFINFKKEDLKPAYSDYCDTYSPQRSLLIYYGEAVVLKMGFVCDVALHWSYFLQENVRHICLEKQLFVVFIALHMLCNFQKGVFHESSYFLFNSRVLFTVSFYLFICFKKEYILSKNYRKGNIFHQVDLQAILAFRFVIFLFLF